jgi:hypothetical protein
MEDSVLNVKKKKLFGFIAILVPQLVAYVKL